MAKASLYHGTYGYCEENNFNTNINGDNLGYNDYSKVEPSLTINESYGLEEILNPQSVLTTFKKPQSCESNADDIQP